MRILDPDGRRVFEYSIDVLKSRAMWLEMTKLLLPLHTGVFDGQAFSPFYVRWIDVEALLKDLLTALEVAHSLSAGSGDSDRAVPEE